MFPAKPQTILSQIFPILVTLLVTYFFRFLAGSTLATTILPKLSAIPADALDFAVVYLPALPILLLIPSLARSTLVKRSPQTLTVLPAVGLLVRPHYNNSAPICIRWNNLSSFFVNEGLHGWDFSYWLSLVDKDDNVHILNREGGSTGEECYKAFACIERYRNAAGGN